jgi:hypothetical protein
MISIFSVPKPFTGAQRVTQENSIRSWQRLCPGCEVILFGNDSGVGDAAARLGAKHVPDVAVSASGTPLLDSVFAKAYAMAAHTILMYVNADIILFPDLLAALKLIGMKEYLVVGRRWDLQLDRVLDFTAPDWQGRLRSELAARAKLHGYSGIDYFIFPRSLRFSLPAFAVGRPGWDNWLVWKARDSGIPVIDATASITAVHQNHDYSHLARGFTDWLKGEETQKNFALSGDMSKMMTIREAEYLLTGRGLRRPPFMRYLFARLSLSPLWRLAIKWKRLLLNRYGA